MRTEGAKTVGLKYAAGEMYLSLSWIQRCFIYWKLDWLWSLTALFLSSPPPPPPFSLPLPLLFLCAGKQDTAEQIFSEFLLFRYARVYTHMHEHAHLWRSFKHWLTGAKSCRVFLHLKLTWMVPLLCIMASSFKSFCVIGLHQIFFNIRRQNLTQPGCVINSFSVMLLLWPLRVAFVFPFCMQCPRSRFQPPHL